jgi:signal transduction histidine kinase
VATYYVVAEAVANAAKHAQPSSVTVRARKAGQHLQIAVQDDGIGGADLSKGSGLIGLKDRIEALSGTMRLVSRRGSGTSLYVDIPLDIGN